MADASARSYAAGVIDGDGHIGMPQRGTIRVVVANTNKTLIDWLTAHFYGGSVTKESFRNLKWKSAYYWTLQGISARLFLQEIAPYLTIKRDRALLAIEADQHHPRAQNSYRALFRALNARGAQKEA